MTTAAVAVRGSPAKQAAPAKKALPLYFVNAWVDFLLIGGISLLAYAVVSLHPEGNPSIWNAGMVLMWVTSWPHFAATSYRLYSTRDNVREYPLTALFVPFLILAGVVGSFASASGIAPHFVRLFLFWSPYHFCGQTLGITLIYAKRAGFSVGKRERLAISSFIFGTFFLSMARAETGARGEFQGVSFQYFGLPSWVSEFARYGLMLSALGFAFFVVRWCMQNKRLLPPIVLLPALTQFVWFVPGTSLTTFSGFVPMFHAMQYLLIAWSMQLKEKLDRSGQPPTTRFVWRESARWGGMNLALGVVLFWAVPELCSLFGGVSVPLAAAIIGSGVQIHHFFVDGVIWKLRNPRVASPLLVNLKQLLTPAGQPVAASAPVSVVQPT